MKVSEAIIIQKEFIANKYHIFRYHNGRLKESMKTLTDAYIKLQDFVEENYPEVYHEYILSLLKEDESGGLNESKF